MCVCVALAKVRGGVGMCVCVTTPLGLLFDDLQEMALSTIDS